MREEGFGSVKPCVSLFVSTLLFDDARETKDYGWEFLYLGANIDAFAAAADIGIDKSHAANWVADASGIGTTFKDIGDAVCCMRESDPAAPYSLSSGTWKKRTDEDYRKRGKK